MRHYYNKSCDIERTIKKEQKKGTATREALMKLERIRKRVKPEGEVHEHTEERTTEEEYGGVISATMQRAGRYGCSSVACLWKRYGGI